MICKKCSKEKVPSDFYRRSGRDGYLPYCKPCHNEMTKERQRGLKKRALDYMGGRCTNCGYNKYDGALEFHHVNPKEKDFTISKVRSLSLDGIKDELDKCIILCSNCHRERHAGLH